jgi:hypothetical protein
VRSDLEDCGKPQRRRVVSDRACKNPSRGADLRRIAKWLTRTAVGRTRTDHQDKAPSTAPQGASRIGPGTHQGLAAKSGAGRRSRRPRVPRTVLLKGRYSHRIQTPAASTLTCGSAGPRGCAVSLSCVAEAHRSGRPRYGLPLLPITPPST